MNYRSPFDMFTRTKLGSGKNPFVEVKLKGWSNYVACCTTTAVATSKCKIMLQLLYNHSSCNIIVQDYCNMQVQDYFACCTTNTAVIQVQGIHCLLYK